MIKPPAPWIMWSLALLYLIQLVRWSDYSLPTKSFQKAMIAWTIVVYIPFFIAMLNPIRFPSLIQVIEWTRAHFLILIILVLTSSEGFLHLSRLLSIQHLIATLDNSESFQAIRDAALKLAWLGLSDLAIEGHQKTTRLDPSSALPYLNLAALFGIMRQLSDAQLYLAAA